VASSLINADDLTTTAATLNLTDNVHTSELAPQFQLTIISFHFLYFRVFLFSGFTFT